MPSVDQILADAWTACAPGRNKDIPFPRGFWPDVARVAVLTALEQPLDFRPTTCTHAGLPDPMQTAAKKRSGKISAAQKAANTAALLAALSGAVK